MAKESYFQKRPVTFDPTAETVRTG
jgi:hypothetical protein